MTMFKCKMCGGNLEVKEGMTVCECEYCGSIQTIPSLDDEKKANLFKRAHRLRRACEFDKAAGVYECIIAEFQEEAEAYWGLILCKYGIEYVEIRFQPVIVLHLMVFWMTRILRWLWNILIRHRERCIVKRQRKSRDFEWELLRFLQRKNRMIFLFVIKKQTLWGSALLIV